MKRFFMMAFGMAFVAVSTAVVMPSQSEAIPAFARQVGMSCQTCHFQHFPKLRAFGRAFKLGGFTDVGTEELIEDEHLSIPAVLNAAFVTKIRYQKTTSAAPLAAGTIAGGTARGNIDFPDESALWLAGRMGEHWGAAIEFPGPLASGKFIFSTPVSFGKAGFALFTTDALGPAFGMELFNGGLARNMRGFEHGDYSAAMAVAGTSGPATGLALFAGGDLFFANVSLWGNSTGAGISAGTSLSSYYRLAFTPQLAGFDTMIGFWGVSGTTKVAAAGATATTNLKTQAWGIDSQAQGQVGGMDLAAHIQYATGGSKNVPVGTTSVYGAGGLPSRAWSADAELSVLPTAGLQIAYMSLDVDTATGAKTKAGDYDAFTLGAFWEIAQNIELMPQYTWYTGNGTTGTNGRPQKNLFTLLFETAF